ncbi:MAG: FtsW/RodA/SpoVE family cell cycle protein, partial [Pseudomonadota bacterium]|nr:FtsW/RodA/SpoVE family cell cycle protein [Pseudomonadota bacterium]
SQPDLGTGVILILIGISIFFIAGVQIWKFILALIASVIATPYLWNFLHSYQQERILAFFNPDKDPLGSGYQIAQSKIAMGSGGVSGKGFLEGTQSHLHFLPETQTDFAFTMIAEEFGFIGGLVLLAIYIMILIYVFSIAMRSKNHFGRMVAIGVSTAFFLYFFINIAMVTGLIPIVGVPLPFISYGGSSLITLMASFGIVMSVHVHRDSNIDPFGRRM